MSMIHHTVTPEKLAANRLNAGKSAGPATPEGKEHAKMNAFKHGRAAARPSPAALMLADCTAPEEAERQALRQQTLRAYLSAGQPADDFAAAEATELADLRFELARLARVREVVWQRERELLELEQRRLRQLHQRAVGATLGVVKGSGLLGLPDSPAKWPACRRALELLAAQFAQRQFDSAKDRLMEIFGAEDSLRRGNQLWKLVLECRKQPEGAAFEAAYQRLQERLTDEIAGVQESLELCQLEQGPLSEAG